MRNAMICVSIMLALYLGWPLAFGGKERGLETAAEAHAVVAVPEHKAKLVTVASVTRPTAPARPESCYKRYQREVKLCEGSAAAACKLGAADHWDMCEATGFWPD